MLAIKLLNIYALSILLGALRIWLHICSLCRATPLARISPEVMVELGVALQDTLGSTVGLIHVLVLRGLLG